MERDQVLRAIELEFTNMLCKVNNVNEFKEFFRVRWLTHSEFEVVFVIPVEKGLGVYGTNTPPFFSIEFDYLNRNNTLNYSVKSKSLIIGKNNRSEQDKFNYEILKIIGYVSKSLFNENGFFIFFDGILNQHMNTVVKRSYLLNEYKKRWEKNTKKDFSLFTKPSFIVYKHISNRSGTIIKIGDIDREWNETETNFTLIKTSKDKSIKNESKIRDYLKKISGKGNSKEAYLGSLIEKKEYYNGDTDTTIVDIGVTKALLSFTGDDLSKMPINPPAFTNLKIYLFVFLMFCDTNILDDFLNKFHIYYKYVTLSLINNLINSSLEYDLFRQKIELPWQIRSEFIEFLESEIFKLFDENNFKTKFDNFYIKCEVSQTGYDQLSQIYGFLRTQINPNSMSFS